MKVKRYLSLLIISIVVVLLMSYTLNGFKGLYLLILVDIHAMLAIIIIPIIILFTKYNFSDFGNSIEAVFKNNLTTDRYKHAYQFFRFQNLAVIYTGAFILCISILIMYRDLSLEHMGRCLGTALCGLLYSLIIVMFVSIPAKIVLKNRLMEQE